MPPPVIGMKKRAIVYWLLPAKAERELFCQIIKILCHELDAPNFEPHVTISLSRDLKTKPKEVLRKLRSKPIRMRITGTATSSQFTKTLFVRLKANGSFDTLTTALAAAAKIRSTRVRNPHISLLYKKSSPATKRELARMIKLPFREITLDSIAVAQVRLPVKTRADVEQWRIVARKSLRR